MAREYTLIRSDRKTLALEITSEPALIVRAPRRCSRQQIDRFVAQKEAWINTHWEIQKSRKVSPMRQAVSAEREQELRRLAAQVLPERVSYFSGLMGLVPTGITVTGAQTRFGSCSGKNRICFSWRLMQYPPAAIDYVVVHELAHIRHHNHSREFYELIARYLPDYKERKKLLR